MEPKRTLWQLEPHTLGKHLVLRKYLNAWLPIMGTWSGRILFIDGFAGPGRYIGGEDGSPMIALKSFVGHRFKGKISAEIAFMFIEKEKARADYLQGLIDDMASTLPPNCKPHVINGVFDETLTHVLDQVDEQAKSLAPCFVMVDPFGVSDTPMQVMRCILRNPKSEVYISFMYEFINRFKTTPEFERHLDQLFGTPEWRNGASITDQQSRKQFYYDLYEGELRKAGAKHIVHFELYEGDRLVYAMFFGTQSLVGCDRMKQAIWAVDPFGSYAFRGARSGQLALGLKNADFGPLKAALRRKYSNTGWVRIEDVANFVAGDETDYHTCQFKRGALVPMEDRGEVEVLEGTRKKRHTYPEGTQLRFV